MIINLPNSDFWKISDKTPAKWCNISYHVILAGTLAGVTRWHSMQSFGGPFHSKITWTGTGLIEGCNRRKCFYCLFIEMECILLRFPTYVIGSSLAKIVKIENTRISNQNDVDRGSDCEVRRAAKTPRPENSDWLLICFTFVTKSPGDEHDYFLPYPANTLSFSRHFNQQNCFWFLSK